MSEPSLPSHPEKDIASVTGEGADGSVKPTADPTPSSPDAPPTADVPPSAEVVPSPDAAPTTPPTPSPDGHETPEGATPPDASNDEGASSESDGAAERSEPDGATPRDATDGETESNEAAAPAGEDAPSGDATEREPSPPEAPSKDAPATDGTPPTGSEDDAPASADGTATDEKAAAQEGGEKPAPKKTKKRERRAPPKPQRVPLTLEQRMEARESARQRTYEAAHREEPQIRAALDLMQEGKSLAFIARFRRHATGGLDERGLRGLREHFENALHEEERRIELAEVLRTHGALDDKTRHRLERAATVAAMEDVAAPHLPVQAGRATVARSLGLEGLAQAIRDAQPGTVLSDLAAPFVKEGEGEEAVTIDAALAGARDILAEELCLNADLRARLRKVFRKEAMLTTALRSERKGDAGRHKSLVGFKAPAGQVPPLKFLALRRAEKDRVVVTTIEPPDESVLPIIHKAASTDDHPAAGFLRAAAEDGYRRILKPLYQGEIRNELKRRADQAAMETFERNLRHRLLGPVGGRRNVLGLRADVTNGHRWCAIDAEGLPTGSGTLPHEGTAGREACLTELGEVLRTYEIQAIAVGSGGGKAEALSLATEAAQTGGLDVQVVPDGGTHVLEAQGPIEVQDRPVVPAEQRGALSLGRRFQDPLAELVTIDPKALALGPHLHEVHQGQLRRLLDETIVSCVAHVGVDPNTASTDLLARVPGFDRASATAFHLWRSEHGALRHKAALAAVPGIGTSVAEQAVGFLRLGEAEDPREHVQLHPEQYGVIDKMANQAGADVPSLFADPAVRAKVKLAELETDETPLPLLKYVLYQATAGTEDPRPAFAQPIAPPDGLTLDTLQPGLILEGRVVRAMPFGVFVDVGMGTDALIPTAHIGDHPGIEPATIAPIGAVVQARVLEVIPEKRRLTLTMRRERFDGPRGRPGRGPRREGGDRFRRADRGGDRRGGDRRGTDHRGGGRGPADRGRGQPRRKKGPQKQGKFGGGGVSEIFGRRQAQHERGVPRSISLSADDAKGRTPSDSEPVAEDQALTPEQLLAKKLEEMKKKLEGEGK